MMDGDELARQKVAEMKEMSAVVLAHLKDDLSEMDLIGAVKALRVMTGLVDAVAKQLNDREWSGPDAALMITSVVVSFLQEVKNDPLMRAVAAQLSAQEDMKGTP